MFLPKKIKKALEESSCYINIRYSKWMYSLWLLLRYDVRKDIAEKSAFYQSTLSKDCKLVFDIGANEGIMTAIFAKLSVNVVAVEPSRRNINILNRKFSGNKNISVLPLAVSDSDGQQTWYEDENDYAMGTLSSKWNDSKGKPSNTNGASVSTITLDAMIGKFGAPDFIKIDIEGNEWQALKGLSQPVSLLSFEAILPQFLDETTACVKQLQKLSSAVLFNYAINNRLFYSSYQPADILLKQITSVSETIDIFCKMQIST